MTKNLLEFDAVLVGSKRHFKPGDSPPETGIGRLLESAFLALQELGFSSVGYFDVNDHVRTTKTRLLVGLEPNFLRFCRATQPDFALLLSVNQIRSLRAGWLKGLSLKNLPRWVALGPNDNLFSLGCPEFHADGVLQLGAHNVEAIKAKFQDEIHVSPIQLSRDIPKPNFGRRPGSHPRILIALGSVSMRKGWLLLEDIVERFAKSGSNFVFVVQAPVSNRMLARRLRRLCAQYPGNLEVSDAFLEEFSDEWNSFFGNIDLAIFPSSEEGQQDAVFTCISMNVPALVSEFTGYKGLLSSGVISGLRADDWHRSVLAFLSQTEAEKSKFVRNQRADLSRLTRTEDSISNAIQDCITTIPARASSRLAPAYLKSLRALFVTPLENLHALTARLLNLLLNTPSK